MPIRARLRSRTLRVAAILAVAWLSALAAHAALAIEVEQLDVRRAEDRYVVEFRAQLDAPVDQVGAVLKDYEHYPDLDPRILESWRDKDVPGRLHTRLRGCVGAILCRSMRRVEAIEEQPAGLTATAIAGQSDVTYGLTQSHWEARGGGTVLSYRLEIEPEFWVPPIIGPRLMISTLREGTLSLFTNVERVARERASRTEAP
jgi:hypothetical protein